MPRNTDETMRTAGERSSCRGLPVPAEYSLTEAMPPRVVWSGSGGRAGGRVALLRPWWLDWSCRDVYRARGCECVEVDAACPTHTNASVRNTAVGMGVWVRSVSRQQGLQSAEVRPGSMPVSLSLCGVGAREVGWGEICRGGADGWVLGG